MQVILIEVYQLTTGLEDIKLGKITKKSFTFEDYVWRALEKLKLDKTKVKFSFQNFFFEYIYLDHIGDN
jgi:hypothetical protein